MYYKKDFEIENFQFWSGAADNVKDLDFDKLQQLGEFLEEYFSECNEEPTETQINDLVWFEWDFICNSLGWTEEEEEEEEE